MPLTAPTMFDLLIGEGRAPPVEFRIFGQGDNVTEKGTFLFDDKAAEQVMAAWTERKIDLAIDYEHQSLAEPPVEAPNAATRWVPQIRNGELWATEVRWTDRAAGYLAAGEYRYFSPAFEFDPKSGRVTRLINIALTNNPAMRGIAPLVAATTKGKHMDWEKLYNDLKADMGAQLSARDAKITELTAQLADKSKKDDPEDEEKKRAAASIDAALSLPAGARAHERASAVVALAGLRSTVRSVTGADSDAAALGKLHGWREASEQVAKLTARVAELETEQLSKEFEGILDDAGKAGKLEPAKREELKATALKMSGGRLTREGVEMARAFLGARPTQVSTTAAVPPKTEGGGPLHPLQLHIAQICGRDPEQIRKQLA